MRIAHRVAAIACVASLAFSSAPWADDKADEQMQKAVEANDVGALKDALKNGARVNTQMEGLPLVTYAAVTGYTKVLHALIEAGANVNAKAKMGGVTPLMGAADMSHGDCVEELLKARANAALTDPDGLTALVRVAVVDNAAMIPVLVRGGADVDQMVLNGYISALTLSASGGKVKSVKALLAAGADPRDSSLDPVIATAEKSNKEIFEILSKARAVAEAARSPVKFAVDPAPRVAVDDHVLGQWPDDGLWYPAKVQKADEWGQVTIAWDDGSDPTSFSARQTRALDWKVGMRIACVSNGEGSFYNATIETKDGDKMKVNWGGDAGTEDVRVRDCRSVFRF